MTVPDSPAHLLHCPGCGRQLRVKRQLRSTDQITCPGCHHQFPVEGNAAQAGPDDNLPQVPGYRILSRLGKGGMGVVYRAWDERLNRPVALKMILRDRAWSAADRERFRAEATAAARLQHPGIVQVFDFGETTGQPYLALEYVDGGTLQQRANRQPQPPRAAAGVVEQIARAVAYMHQQRVLHRDLKPANILLMPVNADSLNVEPDLRDAVNTYGTAKVSDFGLARELDRDQGLTAGGQALGTLEYMAPEQARGRRELVRETADLYSLGAILYELLTGRPPFLAEEPGDLFEQVLNEPPVPPRRLHPKVPMDLERICLKCLEKDHTRRYRSAAELAEDLRRFLRGEPVSASSTGKPGRPVGWRGIAVAVAVAVAVTALAAAGGWYHDRQVQARDHALQLARHEAEHTQNLLTLYSRQVIGKMLKKKQLPEPIGNPGGWVFVQGEKAYIPVPFNFVSQMNNLEEDKVAGFRLKVYVYSDDPFNGRTHKTDPWQQESLEHFRENPEQSERYENKSEVRGSPGNFFRYASPILMTHECWGCHNELKEYRKRPDRVYSEKNKVRGIIDVTIDLDR